MEFAVILFLIFFLAAFFVFESKSMGAFYPVSLFKSPVFIAAILAGFVYNYGTAVAFLQSTNLWQYVTGVSTKDVAMWQVPLVAAGIIGFMMGGTQSMNRSTYSKMLPETQDHASYFSFYEVLEKGGLIIGMFSWGTIEGLTGSMRTSVLALILFFIAALGVLLSVPAPQAGTRAAAR
jgi:UMF1 family MFS transporter